MFFVRESFFFIWIINFVFRFIDEIIDKGDFFLIEKEMLFVYVLFLIRNFRVEFLCFISVL